MKYIIMSVSVGDIIMRRIMGDPERLAEEPGEVVKLTARKSPSHRLWRLGVMVWWYRGMGRDEEVTFVRIEDIKDGCVTQATGEECKMTDVKAGRRIDGEPTDEVEHYMKCNACGGWFDMRDLSEVCRHEEKGHTRDSDQ